MKVKEDFHVTDRIFGPDTPAQQWAITAHNNPLGDSTWTYRALGTIAPKKGDIVRTWDPDGPVLAMVAYSGPLWAIMRYSGTEHGRLSIYSPPETERSL